MAGDFALSSQVFRSLDQSYTEYLLPETIDGDPGAIGDQLSDLGLAVEEMASIGEGLDGIVVARVLDRYA